ncbi:hypothetical protein H6M51_14775 [Rhizobium sp. AQ_MP]|uniref:hypothetical protein n=1 Tax=Rhizobium sp. AQ_MP TaxID=2761536 RepID=UPI00163A3A45|nr:hypothetical protein [Rhizobium sp. AQ_MP]MBC2774125.1 hypothetical protein [Rhizobium sp. AQ_MP]
MAEGLHDFLGQSKVVESGQSICLSGAPKTIRPGRVFANRLALASRTPRDLGTCKLEKLSSASAMMIAAFSSRLAFFASQMSLGSLTRRPEGES